jgi:hypothetical protein
MEVKTGMAHVGLVVDGPGWPWQSLRATVDSTPALEGTPVARSALPQATRTQRTPPVPRQEPLVSGLVTVPQGTVCGPPGELREGPNVAEVQQDRALDVLDADVRQKPFEQPAGAFGGLAFGLVGLVGVD